MCCNCLLSVIHFIVDKLESSAMEDKKNYALSWPKIGLLCIHLRLDFAVYLSFRSTVVEFCVFHHAYYIIAVPFECVGKCDQRISAMVDSWRIPEMEPQVKSYWKTNGRTEQPKPWRVRIDKYIVYVKSKQSNLSDSRRVVIRGVIRYQLLANWITTKMTPQLTWSNLSNRALLILLA